MFDLSLIIVSWNVRSFLMRCLDSIKAHAGNLSLEVIVVDSGSDDGTLDVLREGYRWVRLLPQDENIGFTWGCNLGLAVARGRYLMLLNPDTEIVDDVLTRLVRYLDEHPDVGIVGPRTLNADGTTQHTRRRFPTLGTFVYDNPSLYRYTPRTIKDRYFVADIADTAISDVDWVQGSALMARRQMVEQIGPLDPGYVMFYEEADWCKRSLDKGWRVIYFGQAAIVHHGGRSTRQVPAIKLIHYNRSKLRFSRRYLSPVAALVVRAVVVISYLHQLIIEFLKAVVGRRRRSHYQWMGVYVQVILALCVPRALPPHRTKRVGRTDVLTAERARIDQELQTPWQERLYKKIRQTWSSNVRVIAGRYRSFEILWAGMITVREHGLRAFTHRLGCWLRGERRYKGSSPYRSFQMQFEPDAHTLKQQAFAAGTWPARPMLDVVTVVDSPDLSILRQTASSVIAQSYRSWYWYVVDASADQKVWQYLTALTQSNKCVKLVRGRSEQGIAANMNIALDQIRGDFVVMLDSGDTLAAWALDTVADVICQQSDVDFVYSDFDSLDERGQRADPLFKPDWSPEAMLGYNLLGHLGAFRRSWLDRVGRLNPELEGAQLWDLYLRISEQTAQIFHVPQVLYHRRQRAHAIDEKSIRSASETALKLHLERIGLGDPEVTYSESNPVSKEQPLITWRPSRQRRISIIIPSRDHADVLAECLHSLFKLTTYPDFQVIVVDTGSTERSTRMLYDQYATDRRFKLVHFGQPFNFSQACNLGARNADGELLLFLNNDTEILCSDWLARMAQWFDLSGIGIVGPKLLYPDGRLQHAGVIIGLTMLAGHIFTGADEYTESIFGGDGWYRNLLAVTGACLLISREIFDVVGGFDEDYKLIYSDIKLCLQVREAGYRIVYTPHVRLIHHESLTHRRTYPRADFDLASEHFKSWLLDGDPYFSPNLNYRSPMPRLRQDGQESPYQITMAQKDRLPDREVITVDDL